MLSSKIILRFFIPLLVFSGILLAPWPGLEEAYSGYFRKIGSVSFSRFWFWGDGSVRFLDADNIRPGELPPGLKAPPATDVKDTLMVLEHRKSRTSFGFLRTSSREIGYKCTAVFLALALATPASWRRRLTILGWGLLLMHLFIVLRLTVTLGKNFCGTMGHALFNPSEFWMTVLKKLETILVIDPTVSYMVPAFLWFVLAFRPSQWEKSIGNPKGRKTS